MAQTKKVPAPNLGLKEMTKKARDAWIRSNPGKQARTLGWKKGSKS